jgi:hypothetical protein
VILTGLLTLAASFLPWYRTSWASSSNGVNSQQTNYATAWTASTGWSTAVTIALAATMIWLVAARTSSKRATLAARWASTLLASAAFVMTIQVWQKIPTVTLGGGGWRSSPSDQGSIGTIVRDHLTILHLDGHQRDIAWGLYVGLAAMALMSLALAVFTAMQQHEYRYSRRHHPPDTPSTIQRG